MLKLAANISLLFTERPLLDRFQAARDAGFDAVELQFPYDHDADDLARAREAAGVACVLINAPVLGETHPAGIACRPELGARFAAELARAMDYVQALQARQVNVLAGRRAPGESSDELARVLQDNLVLARERLGGHGIAVLLEAINARDVPDYLVDDFDLAAQLVRAAGVGLQFDVYHAARMGHPPARKLAELLPLVRHVQFADAPDRHEPGSGTIDFAAVLRVLAGSDYAGWVAAEYRPRGTTADGLGWMQAWQRSSAGVPCLP